MLTDRLPKETTISRVSVNNEFSSPNNKNSPEKVLRINKEEDLQILSQINTKRIQITPVKLHTEPVKITPNLTILSSKGESPSNFPIRNQSTVFDEKKQKETNEYSTITLTPLKLPKLPMITPKILDQPKDTISSTNLTNLENRNILPEPSINPAEQKEHISSANESNNIITILTKRPRGRPASKKIENDLIEAQHIPKRPAGRPRKKSEVLLKPTGEKNSPTMDR